MNADDLYEALKRRHPLPEWILVRELRIGTGYSSGEWDGRKWKRAKMQQRIDAWALNCYPSKDFIKIAYEIKVSRSDFLNEKNDPEKRKAALEISDLFYFVAPRGLIAPMELPKDCGLLVVYDSGRSEILQEAPKRQAERLDWRLVASVLRNVMKARKEDLARDRFAE
jgi:hypothetical protein